MLLFYKLLVGHALADYPLQQDFLGKGKCAKSQFPGIKWYWVLFWHALIHSGIVYYITGNIYFALFELGIHIIIDHLKCIGLTNYEQDQTMHIICKLVYSLVTIVK